MNDWCSDLCSSDLPEPRHPLDRIADHPPDALSHLARRLVGEGHREDFGRPGAPRRDDVREAGGERRGLARAGPREHQRSEEHTSELQSLMRISYAVFCLKKKTTIVQQ